MTDNGEVGGGAHDRLATDSTFEGGTVRGHGEVHDGHVAVDEGVEGGAGGADAEGHSFVGAQRLPELIPQGRVTGGARGGFEEEGKNGGEREGGGHTNPVHRRGMEESEGRGWWKRGDTAPRRNLPTHSKFGTPE